MGLKLTPSQRKAILPAARPGQVRLFLQGIVPQSTSQDKLTGISFSGKRVVYDHKRLKSAKAWYDQRIPSSAYPVQGPLMLMAEFRWHDPSKPSGTPCPHKCDWDNLSKVAADALARAGYLVDDAEICFATVEKTTVETTEEAGVILELWTLVGTLWPTKKQKLSAILERMKMGCHDRLL